MAKRKAKRAKKGAKKVKRRVAAKKKSKKDPSSLWVPAGIIVGVGAGLYYNAAAVGTLIGLGAGLVLMALHRMLRK